MLLGPPLILAEQSWSSFLENRLEEARTFSFFSHSEKDLYVSQDSSILKALEHSEEVLFYLQMLVQGPVVESASLSESGEVPADLRERAKRGVTRVFEKEGLFWDMLAHELTYAWQRQHLFSRIEKRLFLDQLKNNILFCLFQNLSTFLFLVLEDLKRHHANEIECRSSYGGRDSQKVQMSFQVIKKAELSPATNTLVHLKLQYDQLVRLVKIAREEGGSRVEGEKLQSLLRWLREQSIVLEQDCFVKNRLLRQGYSNLMEYDDFLGRIDGFLNLHFASPPLEQTRLAGREDPDFFLESSGDPRRIQRSGLLRALLEKEDSEISPGLERTLLTLEDRQRMIAKGHRLFWKHFQARGGTLGPRSKRKPRQKNKKGILKGAPLEKSSTQVVQEVGEEKSKRNPEENPEDKLKEKTKDESCEQRPIESVQLPDREGLSDTDSEGEETLSQPVSVQPLLPPTAPQPTSSLVLDLRIPSLEEPILSDLEQVVAANELFYQAVLGSLSSLSPRMKARGKLTGTDFYRWIQDLWKPLLKNLPSEKHALRQALEKHLQRVTPQGNCFFPLPFFDGSGKWLQTYQVYKVHLPHGREDPLSYLTLKHYMQKAFLQAGCSLF